MRTSILRVVHPSREALLSLARSQRAVEQAAHRIDARPGDVLVVGRMLLRLAEHEQDALLPILPLLDPAVRAILEAEHQQIDEDLTLLDWLAATDPDSPDIAVLTTSLTRRIREHLGRDRRLLDRAMSLIAARKP